MSGKAPKPDTSEGGDAFQHTVDMGNAPAERGRGSLLRDHQAGPAAVSFLELFFDLVYVFALTQISHLILARMTWNGIAEAVVAFAAVWWAWMYTTWAVNWADPEKLPIRLMLILVMLASLVMAVALPRAFDDGGLLFAGSYVAIQVGRTLFMALIMTRARSEVTGRNMLRVSVWFMASAVFWLVGAFAPADARLWWWLGALAIEYAGPLAFFVTPFLGRSTLREWTISGHHMAERCALFIIIALGEGIVVTGATFAGQPIIPPRAAAFLIAFSSSVMMWWLYFDVGAKRGAELIETHAEPGRLARSAYTYLHMPIVVGMIGAAVADELLLAHPDGPASHGLVVFLCGGLAIYLGGIGWFKRFANPLRNFPLSHMVGLGLFAALGAWGWFAAPPGLLVGSLGVAVLVVVAVWEWGSVHGGWSERLARLS